MKRGPIWKRKNFTSSLSLEWQSVHELIKCAAIGSVSPYVGLFGTVWGIMAAFSSLSQVSEASIAMVAPGISEALVATALGLFAAIPAVIAYNRFVQLVDRLLNRFEAFEDEFASLLYRHTQQKNQKHARELDDAEL